MDPDRESFEMYDRCWLCGKVFGVNARPGSVLRACVHCRDTVVWCEGSTSFPIPWPEWGPCE